MQMRMPGLRMISSCAPFLPNRFDRSANVPVILVGEFSCGLKTLEFFSAASIAIFSLG